MPNEHRREKKGEHGHGGQHTGEQGEHQLEHDHPDKHDRQTGEHGSEHDRPKQSKPRMEEHRPDPGPEHDPNEDRPSPDDKGKGKLEAGHKPDPDDKGKKKATDGNGTGRQQRLGDQMLSIADTLYAIRDSPPLDRTETVWLESSFERAYGKDLKGPDFWRKIKQDQMENLQGRSKRSVDTLFKDGRLEKSLDAWWSRDDGETGNPADDPKAARELRDIITEYMDGLKDIYNNDETALAALILHVGLGRLAGETADQIRFYESVGVYDS